MHGDFGCDSCSYIIPGCFSCHEVGWNSGIPLDNLRLQGPDADQSYLSCERCEVDQRFVSIQLDTSVAVDGFDYSDVDYSALPNGVQTVSPVKCDSCLSQYDGCAACGTYGETCSMCLQTHALYPEDTTGLEPCKRCDFFMNDCLLCNNRE